MNFIEFKTQELAKDKLPKNLSEVGNLLHRYAEAQYGKEHHQIIKYINAQKVV